MDFLLNFSHSFQIGEIGVSNKCKITNNFRIQVYQNDARTKETREGKKHRNGVASGAHRLRRLVLNWKCVARRTRRAKQPATRATPPVLKYFLLLRYIMESRTHFDEVLMHLCKY